jgi:hypothetical protein
MHVNYSTFVSEIFDYKRIELTGTEKSFLLKIMSGHSSSFKITSYIKSRRQPMVYKNEYAAVGRLQELNLIEEEGKFLRGAIYYKLTTFGLFYIFSRMSSYPPKLLTRYQDNILLKTLLYPYFEIDTIKSCTARLYSVIIQYLRECCETTLCRLEEIRTAIKSGDRERHVKGLQSDLEWHVRILGFRLAIMYNESNILGSNPDVANDNTKVVFYELESTMKMLLSKDNRFINLLDSIEKEFLEGYKELSNNNNVKQP